MNRFVALLHQAGKSNARELLKESTLVKWQQVVLEPRYAAQSFRNFQNYVGQSLPNFQELVHYVCPPPDLLPELMAGMQAMVNRTSHLHPVVQAAMVSFAFVLAHPFEDGNGRMHRFLIHDMLNRGGLVPGGMIVPVSAHMLLRPKEYDTALEAFSKPLMERVQYTKTPEGELVLKNETDVVSYFRYPDLTAQTQYLAKVIAETIAQDMPAELDFLFRFDQLKKALREVVDMPDRKLDLMISFLHQNKGVFPNRKRKQFEELTDKEVGEMEEVYKRVFVP
jgi:Fic family protein